MNETAEVEALVVEYRSPEKTLACIESLLAAGAVRVVVVDNSDDEGRTSARLLQGFGGDRRLEILDSGSNLGFARAVNLGLRHCTSRRVLLINNDAVVNPGAIGHLQEALQSSGHVVAVPTLMHAGERLQRIYYHPWTLAITSLGIPGSFEVPRGCCMLVAIERLPEGPLFDERFFMYGEEIELGWRLRQANLRVEFAPLAVVEHVGSAASVRGSLFYEQRTALAHRLLDDTFKRQGVGGLAMTVSRRLALFVRATIRSIRGRSPVPWIAYCRVIGVVRDDSPLAPPPT